MPETKRDSWTNSKRGLSKKKQPQPIEVGLRYCIILQNIIKRFTTRLQQKCLQTAYLCKIILHRFNITCVLDLTEVRYDMTCEEVKE